MKVRGISACIGLGLLLWPWPEVAAPKKGADAEVILSNDAPELERFAALELCRYLEKLFGVRAQPSVSLSNSSAAVFFVGSPQVQPLLKQATAKRALPKLTDQGIMLRREQAGNHPALIIAGGSPRATLWGVYELLERWGVRYLTGARRSVAGRGGHAVVNDELHLLRGYLP